MVTELKAPSLWTETFFHVLAHVESGAIASSCHSPAYARWAEQHLGAASTRSLGEDARTLAQVAATHDELARLQLLAFLFDTKERAHAASERDLADLSAADVVDADALRAANACGAPAEIVRAATELELDVVASLPPAAIDEDAIARAFERIGALAPELSRFSVEHVRALGVRGRAYRKTILVGTPGIAGADAEHIAWQAAHEALVASVPPPRSFVDVERAAIATLRSRARAANLGDDHARWLGHFDLSGLGPIPDVPDGT